MAGKIFGLENTESSQIILMVAERAAHFILHPEDDY
jgi:hypothetical protein